MLTRVHLPCKMPKSLGFREKRVAVSCSSQFLAEVMAHLLIVDRLLEVDLKEIIMPHSKTIYETLVVFYAAACQTTSLASYEQHMAPKI